MPALASAGDPSKGSTTDAVCAVLPSLALKSCLAQCFGTLDGMDGVYKKQWIKHPLLSF